MVNVAHNSAIDALRIDRKLENHVNWAFVSETDFTSSSIFTPLPAKLDLKSIVECVGEDRKLLIEMVYLQSYTDEEASDRLNLPWELLNHGYAKVFKI